MMVVICGTAKYFWRSEAQTTLQDSLKIQPVVGVAKNVIMFLGDGMGVSTVTGGRILKGQLQNKTGEETVLSWEKFPNVALSKVNHEPNYNDRFFPQCESYTRQEVRVILEICSKNLPSVLVIRMLLFSSAGFLIYIIL